MLQEFGHVFGKITRLAPKRNTYFSIDLMHGTAPVSKIPYIMNTLELKESQM